MSPPEDSSSLPTARAELNSWLQATTGEHFGHDAVITSAFCAQVKERFHLDLVTNWNPSACVFDSRWLHQGHPAEGIDKPFSAEAQEESQLLACAALLHLIKDLEK